MTASGLLFKKKLAMPLPSKELFSDCHGFTCVETQSNLPRLRGAHERAPLLMDFGGVSALPGTQECSVEVALPSLPHAFLHAIFPPACSVTV